MPGDDHVSKTLLAVDDSATMRKVLEITFSGEDFTVITAESSQQALGKLGEKPVAVLIDTSLGSDDGYALAKEVRQKDPATAIVLLASRYAPYDAAKGKEAGADDFMDKPFDTQQMIDKVRKVLLGKEGVPAAAAQAPVAAAAAASKPIPAAAQAASSPGAKVRARTETLAFGDEAPSGRSGAVAKPPAESPKRPEPAPQASAAALTSGNGHLAGKLSELGLSSAQADAVMALSRELVERVVWEVVPQLAEALIKEEIARLTR
jgi:DNA-binding response OmpR family regulator